LNKLESEQRS